MTRLALAKKLASPRPESVGGRLNSCWATDPHEPVSFEGEVFCVSVSRAS